MRETFAASLATFDRDITTAIEGVRADLRQSLRAVVISNLIALAIIAALSGVTTYLKYANAEINTTPAETLSVDAAAPAGAAGAAEPASPPDAPTELTVPLPAGDALGDAVSPG